MQIPDASPSEPEGACTSTGAPVTFCASAGVMIEQTSIFLPAADPVLAPVVDDVAAPPPEELELLPQPASTTAVNTTADATNPDLGRMVTTPPGTPIWRVTVRGHGSPGGDRCHTARREDA